MQSAGAPAGPFGQAAQNADERRRAVCRAALRVSSVSGGRCRRRRDGEGKAPSLRALAKPSGFDGRSFFNTQKGSGSRSQEPLPAVLWGM